jgi:lysophospholipase L1-like esterase
MKWHTILLPVLLSMAGCKTSTPPAARPVPEANQTAPETTPVRTEKRPILFIVGDSTVHNTAPGLVGWGDVIDRHFDPSKIKVENHARPGRSTRTFISQGWWAQILAVARPGDFVIIQMGHNDSSPVNDSQRARGSLPGISHDSTNLVNGLTHRTETVHTYGDYLRQYVAQARARGMTPLLCTPVPRLPQPGRESDTVRHATWMREMAAADSVELIDLNRRVQVRWEGKTTAELKSAFFATNDTTHFNRAGAEVNATCVVEGLRTLTNCPLASCLLPEGRAN